MPDPSNDTLVAFADHLTAQLAKNGYPARRVAFPIERMYASAAAKGLSFNKVLDVLAERGIGHEKTPEKVIFAPAVVAPEVSNPLAGFDPSMFEGMSQESLIAAARAAMQQMSPDQLAALQSMLEGMTPEQQAALVEQVRKLGLG
jgi:hypothetical protein